MNIEELIAANTAALVANTAALLGAKTSAGSTGAAETKTTGTTKTTTKTTPKVKGATRDDMVAALTEVKEKFGAAEAKTIVSKIGGTAKMVDIEDDKIDAVFKAAKAKLEVSEDDAGDGDDDGL